MSAPPVRHLLSPAPVSCTAGPLLPARLAVGLLLLLSGACASAPPVVPVQVSPWERKMTAMLRLEDARILREPAPAAAPVPPPARRRGRDQVAPPPARLDLTTLIADDEARVRRRAALAIGRVRLPEGVPVLAAALQDAEPEVRQMAAFAIGLISDRGGRAPLLAALKDANGRVQGRAAQALGLIGDAADAAAIADMVRAHVSAGVLQPVAPDDLTSPLSDAVEAVRLGLYALAKLAAWDALAQAALDGNGQPVSRWWPVAFALQRVGDPRAVPALLALADTPGRVTRTFAAKGLGAAKDPRAVDVLVTLVSDAEPAVAVEAIRALGQIGDARAVKPLLAMASAAATSPTLRVEAVTALGQLRARDATDLLLDLLSDPWAAQRSAALQALAQVDAEVLITALSGMDPDPDWTVRAALASVLASMPPAIALLRVQGMVKDPDQRVVAPALAALAALHAPDAARVMRDHLSADDPVVRAAAATALGELRVAGTAPALVEAYRAGQRDATYVARTAALAALTRLGGETAVPTLREALRDRDWAVRVRAASLLTSMVPGEDAAETIRPAPNQRPVPAGEDAALVSPAYSPVAYIETDRGTIQVELAILDAPRTVANFMALARRGFFSGVPIHRVVPDFVVQDGDPRGDGEGSPGYTIRDEINERPYLRGTVGMALDWEDTGGSQFFIALAPQPHLDARYTVFGQVIDGMAVVDRLQQWDVIRKVRIWDGVTVEP